MSDFLEINNRPLRDLQAEVDDNMDRRAVEDASLVEMQYGPASAAFRVQGGFLTRLALQSMGSGELVDVLYSDSDLTKPKLPASHAMLPVGRTEDWPGGQHGPVRWVKHDIVEPKPGGVASQIATLVPRMSQGMPFVVRHAQLAESVLALGLSVTNRREQPLGLSLGEHFYFKMPAGSAGELRIYQGSDKPQTIDGLLGDGSSDLVDEGIAQFWSDFGGQAGVIMPNGDKIAITASLAERNQSTPDLQRHLGMLIWRRPGASFICLEPTAGYDIDGSNDNLLVSPGADVMLTTRIIAV
jgi:hypothetical protein